MILTITLNLSIDKVLKVKELKRGSINRVELISLLPGGKGVNVARCIKSLGLDVYTTGFRGKEFGEVIEKKLLDEGLTPLLFGIKGDNRTCNILIEDDGTITEIYERGPFIYKEESENFLEFIKKIKDRFTHIVISGSLPLGLKSGYYRRIIMNLKDKKVFVDFSKDALLEALKEKPYFVKVNEREFKETFNKNPLRGIREISEEFKIKIFSITLGKEGAIFYFDGKVYRVYSEFNVKVVNPVGAGDSFMGGFVYSDFLGKDLFTSFKIALSSSISNVTLFEGGRINREIFYKVFERVKIEEV